MKLVDMQEFSSFLIAWYQKRYLHQRLGQAFINNFFIPGVGPDTELFYEMDTKKAIKIIYSKYIKEVER